MVMRFLHFFACSDLVTEAMRGSFRCVWANDLDMKKAEIYTANHGNQHFVPGSIAHVNGAAIPSAQLAWASFPCQDLSLAGPMGGIGGHRSGLGSKPVPLRWPVGINPERETSLHN